MIFHPQETGPPRPSLTPRVSIPVPLITREVGAGQLVKGLADLLGIPQCGGCEERQGVMDRALGFRPVEWRD